MGDKTTVDENYANIKKVCDNLNPNLKCVEIAREVEELVRPYIVRLMQNNTHPPRYILAEDGELCMEEVVPVLNLDPNDGPVPIKYIQSRVKIEGGIIFDPNIMRAVMDKNTHDILRGDLPVVDVGQFNGALENISLSTTGRDWKDGEDPMKDIMDFHEKFHKPESILYGMDGKFKLEYSSFQEFYQSIYPLIVEVTYLGAYMVKFIEQSRIKARGDLIKKLEEFSVIPMFPITGDYPYYHGDNDSFLEFARQEQDNILCNCRTVMDEMAYKIAGWKEEWIKSSLEENGYNYIVHLFSGSTSIQKSLLRSAKTMGGHWRMNGLRGFF